MPAPAGEAGAPGPPPRRAVPAGRRRVPGQRGPAETWSCPTAGRPGAVPRPQLSHLLPGHLHDAAAPPLALAQGGPKPPGPRHRSGPRTPSGPGPSPRTGRQTPRPRRWCGCSSPPGPPAPPDGRQSPCPPVLPTAPGPPGAVEGPVKGREVQPVAPGHAARVGLEPSSGICTPVPRLEGVVHAGEEVWSATLSASKTTKAS